MSGHSKWANIKHRKSAEDAKRGKIFTKLIKEIHAAVKEGGPEPENNPKLRVATQNAKGANMPKDTIDRAIKKAAGDDATQYNDVSFEGYGPGGIAVFVEGMTDNHNRTVASVRSIFNKRGGSLGTKGSLDFLFDRKGVFTLKTPESLNFEELELELIDGGAEEIEENEGHLTVYTPMDAFGDMQKKLDELAVEVENSSLQRIPKTTTPVSNEDAEKVLKLVDALEDDDDVQKVYHNLELSEEQMNAYAES